MVAAAVLGDAWRWVIFTCTLILAGFTVARGVMGAFYTELYPSFSTPHPINVLAMLATNVSLVLVNLAALVAWREEAEAKLRSHAYTDALQAALLAHPSLKVSYSAGLAILQRGDASLTALMGRADLGLYQAKHLGRGRLQVAD